MVKRILIFFLLFVHLIYADIISIGVGINNVLRPEKTGECYLEYKFDANIHKFCPFLGSMMTFKSSFYIYTGISADLVMYDRFIFAPEVAVGYYNKGRGKNLGYPIEFRPGIKIGYQFKNLSRIGLHFYHMSNAGLGHHNPGLESLVLFYSFSL